MHFNFDQCHWELIFNEIIDYENYWFFISKFIIYLDDLAEFQVIEISNETSSNMEDAYRNILQHMGEDVNREG